jgi:Na+/H+ antiporter NhaD/arsenite permease-like protein
MHFWSGFEGPTQAGSPRLRRSGDHRASDGILKPLLGIKTDSARHDCPTLFCCRRAGIGEDGKTGKTNDRTRSKRKATICDSAQEDPFMQTRKTFLLLTLVVTLVSATLAFAGGHGSEHEGAQGELKDGDTVNIAGIIHDSHKEPVGECHVTIYENGSVVDHLETAHKGNYITRFKVEKGSVPGSTFVVEAKKASFKTQTVSFAGSDFAQKGDAFFVTEDLMLLRTQGAAFWIATLVFVLAYVLIAFELLHRTIAAMLGAALMLCLSYTLGTINPEFRIFSFERAIGSIDMNVILLLMGMMIIVGVLKNTGVFQWCAYMSYKIAKGRVFILTVILMSFTAVTSAFLDNVTTMLLLTGVAIEICLSVKLNPLSMLIPLVLASNVGGTATLIGDPPNIMIGSYAGLTFMDFVVALTLICVVAMVAMFLYTKVVWGKDYAESQASVADVGGFTAQLKEKYKIYDSTLLSYGLVILGFTVFLFLSHGYWHMEVSIAALTGASVLFTVAIVTKKVDMIHLIEKDIEWPTLMFFMFLFIIVGAVDEAGLLAVIADWILEMSKGNFMLSMTLILWVSAIASAFVDNIPFTATMLPIVAYLSKVILPGGENTLWWALALGACLGGNGTIIGASANVVTMGIAESKGYKISFGRFMKVAFPYMLLSIVICQAWLMIFRPA